MKYPRALGVHVGQSLRDLDSNVRDDWHRKDATLLAGVAASASPGCQARELLRQLADIEAIDDLEHQIIALALFVAAKVHNGHDVRVSELSCDLHLRQKVSECVS